MMDVTVACPDETSILRFASGQLQGDTTELDLHLDSCERCRKTVAAFALGSDEQAVTSAQLVDDLPPDTVVGRFVIVRRLGAGAMGVVYQARDPKLQRNVAIKLLGYSAADDNPRLQREAQTMAQLTHPNIVVVYEIGEYQRNTFIAMEIVDGPTLRTWCAGKHTLAAKIQMLQAIAAGVHAAHRAGVIHRDLKPDNVLVGSDDRPRVSDFGLAFAGVPDATTALRDPSTLPMRLTATGALLGTPAYMAPEVLAGGPATIQSDIFSYAVLAWEVLTGALPFAASDVATLRRAINRGELNMAAAHAAALPPSMIAALQQGLAPEPTDRPSSMASFAAPAVVPMLPQPRRWRAGVAAATIFACVAAGTTWALSQRSTASDPCALTPRTLVVPPLAANLSPTLPAQHLRQLIEAANASDQLARLAICRATRVAHNQSDSAHDARMQCTNELHGQLAALLEGAATLDQVSIGQVNDAIAQLPQANECIVASATAPARSPSQQRQVDVLDGQMQRIRAGFAHNNFATDAAQQTLAAATTLGDAPTIAAAAITAALAWRGGANYEQADRDALVAITTAEQAGLVELCAQAWIVRLSIAGERADYSTAKQWLPLAAVAVRKLPNNPRITARFENDAGLLALAINDLPGAKAHFDRAIELRTALYGETANADVARTLSGLGHHARLTNDFANALTLHRRALKFDRAVLGESHRDVARDLHNVAGILRLSGDIKGAVALYTEALALRSAVLGANHPLVGLTNNSLGLIALEQHRWSDAETFFTTAAKILRAAANNDWAIAEENLGRLALARGDGATAEVHVRAALEQYQRQFVGKHPRPATALMALAEAALLRRRPTEAKAWLDQATASLPDDELLNLQRQDLSTRIDAAQPKAARPRNQVASARPPTPTQPLPAVPAPTPAQAKPNAVNAVAKPPVVHPGTYGSSSGWE